MSVASAPALSRAPANTPYPHNSSTVPGRRSTTLVTSAPLTRIHLHKPGQPHTSGGKRISMEISDWLTLTGRASSKSSISWPSL